MSLTVRMYRALSDYAEIVGRTRTAIIVEAMGDRLPFWESQVRSRRARQWHDDKSLEQAHVRDAAIGGVVASVANQQALSNLERERKRGEKMARRAKAAKR